ncbi:MAG: LptF/LptG family permease [Deltaproteobacteria bacterium]|nr:LptF/LptG family permease [Deltaproteobacteria bacterium]
MLVVRYIARTIVAPFLALLLLLALVSSVMQLSRLGEVAFGALGDLGAFLRLSLYVAPSMAGVALPVALLMACLIAFDRLAESGELFACAAGGCSSRRLFGASGVIALPVAVFSLWVQLQAVPWGIGQFLDQMAALATRSFAQALKPQAFTEMLGTTALYASAIDAERATWRGVFLAHAPAGVERELLVFAPAVSVTPRAEERAAVLHIERGQTLMLGAGPEIVEQVSFQSGQGLLDLRHWAHRETAIYYDYQAHGLLDLVDDLAEEQRPRDHRKIEFFMWQKLTLPFGCFPLALIGALLGAGRRPERRARAYVWGLVTAVLFFVGHEAARGLCADGSLRPLAAAWTAVALAALAAAALWRQRAGLRT